MMSTLKWAYITSTAPLRLRLEHDSVALPMAPSTLLDPLELSVGEKVYVHDVPGLPPVIVGTAGGYEVGAGWRRSVSVGASGWRTIATWPGNGRASGVFTLQADDSGDHDQLVVRCDVSYAHAVINVESYNTFGRSSPAITGVRYLTSSADPIYAPGMLQVSFAESLSDISLRCEQPTDPNLKPWEPGSMSTSTAGYTVYDQVGVYVTGTQLLTPLNGWAHYSGAPSWQEASVTYRNGIVTLTGLLSAANKTANTIAVLPDGCRPAGDLIFITQAWQSSNNVLGRINITDGGSIDHVHPSGTISYASLSGISFPAHH